MKKALLILLLSLILFISCSTEDGQVLKIGLAQQPSTLDAQIETSQAVRIITLSNIYEKLVTINKNGDAVPELAKSFTISKDAKSITFKLRDDVTFHNGKKMKAEDVVASMNRWIENYHVPQTILGDARFREVDEHTVEVVSNKSIFSLVDVMANSPQAAIIMPKKVIDTANEDGSLKEYIGTGVYKFSSWVKDEYIEITRFKDYVPTGGKEVYGLAGQKQGNIENIRFYFEPDQTLRTQALENGEYHFANLINNDDFEKFNNLEGFKAYSRSEEGSLAIVFNKRSPVA